MITLTDSVKDRLRIQRNKLFVKTITDMYNISNPLLENIHYSKDGHAEITNNIVAIRLSNVHDGSLHEEIKGYPDMNPIMIQSADNHQNIILPVQELEKKLHHPGIKEDIDLMNIHIKNDRITMVPQTADKQTTLEKIILNGEFDIDEELAFIIRPRILHDAFNFFRMLGISEVNLYVDDKRDPIRLIHDNVQYLIAPIIRN